MLPFGPIHSTPILALLLTLTIHLPVTSARCCIQKGNRMCDNNIPLTQGQCCGHGPCNIFCCNCDFGCIGSPPIITTMSKTHGEMVDANVDNSDSNNHVLAQYAVCGATTGSSIFSGDEDCGSQLFHLLDVDGIGKISLSQYLGWFVARNSDVGAAGDVVDVDDEELLGAVEHFHSFDADGDGFVDEVEMRRAGG